MLIQDALKKKGMSMDSVKIDNRELVSEIGFVGIMNEKNKFKFGITYTGIDSFDFVDEELKESYLIFLLPETGKTVHDFMFLSLCRR